MCMCAYVHHKLNSHIPYLPKEVVWSKSNDLYHDLQGINYQQKSTKMRQYTCGRLVVVILSIMKLYVHIVNMKETGRTMCSF